MTTDEARAALLDDLDKAFTEPVIAPVTWRLALRPSTEKKLDALIAAIRAEGRDPYDSLTEHRQQERAGTHLQDTTDCYFCQRAESAETMAALREAAQTVIDHYVGKDATVPMLTWADIAALERAALAATPAEDEEGRT